MKKNSRRIHSIIFIFFLIFAGRAQENSSDEGITLRILSYNIHHGETTNGDLDLKAVAKVINEVNPDLVALQEVDYKTDRVEQRDILSELATLTKMPYSFFGKAVNYDGGEYGVGVLSKWEFLETTNIPLPHEPGKEPRTMAGGTILVESGDTITFFSTHLDHLKDDTERISQVRKIENIFSKSRYPKILAGDLNDVPGSTSIRILESNLKSSYDKDDPQPTFPSSSPIKKIDYVMGYPKEKWKIVETKVICDKIASDHCAYLVVLKLLP
ncbi:MAG TPA: endonuclease/exonuclease/phosphatase family protein [Salinimicrobium sp.]|nr:endonuclease/exonuclease/phosphatase family protein [Salinimicrobium sp.]